MTNKTILIDEDNFVITDNTEDDFQTVSVVGVSFGGMETNSFTNVLPSVNITFELDEEKLLRFAAYKAIARPDVRQMTAALSLSEDSQYDSAEDTIGQLISAAGNPFLEPLEATNLDVSWEWYISDTSFMSIAAYWKELKTGTSSTTEQLSIDVDGFVAFSYLANFWAAYKWRDQSLAHELSRFPLCMEHHHRHNLRHRGP